MDILFQSSEWPNLAHRTGIVTFHGNRGVVGHKSDNLLELLRVVGNILNENRPDIVDITLTMDDPGDRRIVAETEWAGYTPDGMDYRGHMHPHPDGSFYRSGDGLKGFYCAAPLIQGECHDPNLTHFFPHKG